MILSTQSDNDKLKKIKEFEPYLNYLKYNQEINEIIDQITNKEVRNNLKQLRKEEIKSPKIVVIGEPKTGKSTLLNQILYKDIFPRNKETPYPIHLIVEEAKDKEELLIQGTDIKGLPVEIQAKIEENFEKPKDLKGYIQTIILYKQTKNHIPLYLIDTPGLHYNRELSKEIITEFLNQDNIIYLFTIKCDEHMDNNLLLDFLKNFFQDKEEVLKEKSKVKEEELKEKGKEEELKKKDEGKEKEFKKKIRENSLLVFTKCALYKEFKNSPPKFDFIKSENIFYTAYDFEHSKGKKNLAELKYNEEEFFKQQNLFPGKCGTEAILGFIGTQYSRILKNLSINLGNYIIDCREKLKLELSENWKFWNEEKEKGFKKFKKEFIENIQPNSKKDFQEFMKNNLRTDSFVNLVQDFQVFFIEFICNSDEKCIRYDFILEEIKNMIDDYLKDLKPTLKMKWNELEQKHNILKQFNMDKLITDDLNNTFQRELLYYLFQFIKEMVEKYEPNEIKENQDYLSLFEAYQKLTKYDLSKIEKLKK